MTRDREYRQSNLAAQKRIEWSINAAENVDRWGNQGVATLFLALVEELGEVAAVLEGDIPPGTPDSDVAAFQVLIHEMARLGDETQTRLEETFEDDDGQPLPEAERELVRQQIFKRGVSDPDAVQDEVDDLAPLLFQLTWALDDERDSG